MKQKGFESFFLKFYSSLFLLVANLYAAIIVLEFIK